MGTPNLVDIFAGKKVFCSKCGVGFFEPVCKNTPIEKVNVFRCNNCDEHIHILRKTAMQILKESKED